MKANLGNTNAAINHLSNDEYRWFAVYTKYKCEKYVVDKLSKKGIAAYVPLVDVTKRYTSKIKRYQVPLINSYVFVKILKAEYIPVLETEYVLGFLKQRKNLISIPESEIEILRRVVGEKCNIELYHHEVVVGDRVEIISGNLTGLIGRIENQHGKSRFLVHLENIGYSLSIEVEKNLLRLVEK